MPRGYRDYSFVVDNSFTPFTMQEMLTPFLLYKDAYEEREKAFEELSKEADQFKYLSSTLPEGSESRQIYEGYANELSSQAADLATNGLSLANKSALTSLKNRFQGEIGLLVNADTALQEEKKLRRAASIKDPSMLYGQENLNIDDYLYGKTPNLYSVSGNAIYARGLEAGKTASSRLYDAKDEGSTLGGYYRKWVERHGYSKEAMDAFRENASSIPELQQAAKDILVEMGAYEGLKDNPYAIQRAEKTVLNGIIDGAITEEKVTPIRDAGRMSATEAAHNARAKEQNELQRDKFNFEKNTSGIVINEDGTVSYDPSRDATYQRMVKMKELYGDDDSGNEYVINPYTGKPVKKTPSAEEKEEVAARKAEAKEEAKRKEARDKALLALTHTELTNNKGFDVNLGDDREHYDYIGLMANSRGKWRVGPIGSDVEGHGWAMLSSNNLENGWGSFSMESIDDDQKTDVKVLSESELNSVLRDDAFRKAFYDYIEAFKKQYNLPDSFNPDIQVVEVPNESDSNKKGYAIAIMTQ